MAARALTQRSGSGPGRVGNVFCTPITPSNRGYGPRRDRLSLFLLYRVWSQSECNLGPCLSNRNGLGGHHDTLPSSPDRSEERFNTDDDHHAREVVGEHVQRHLSRHFWQRLHQKVRRPHPHLQRAKRMLRPSRDEYALHPDFCLGAPARHRQHTRPPIA